MKYYFIVNPGSRTGRAKELWDGMQERLEKSGKDFEVIYTLGKNDARDAAASVCEKDPGQKRIVVAGGDGTVGEVLSGIKNPSKVTLGILPTGSSNDLARGLGITSDIKKAFERVLVPRNFIKMDIGQLLVDDEDPVLFGVSSSIGYDAMICHKALKSRLKRFLNFIGKGRLVYYITGLVLIFTCKRTKASVIIDGKRKLSFKKLIFAACMNTKYEGGGMPMGPDADPCDGKITLCIVHGISRLRHLLYMPTVIKGKHINHKGVEQITCNTCEIITDAPMHVHADGEPCGIRAHVKFSLTGDKLRVMR